MLSTLPTVLLSRVFQCLELFDHAVLGRTSRHLGKTSRLPESSPAFLSWTANACPLTTIRRYFPRSVRAFLVDGQFPLAHMHRSLTRLVLERRVPRIALHLAPLTSLVHLFCRFSPTELDHIPVLSSHPHLERLELPRVCQPGEVLQGLLEPRALLVLSLFTVSRDCQHLPRYCPQLQRLNLDFEESIFLSREMTLYSLDWLSDLRYLRALRIKGGPYEPLQILRPLFLEWLDIAEAVNITFGGVLGTLVHLAPDRFSELQCGLTDAVETLDLRAWLSVPWHFRPPPRVSAIRFPESCAQPLCERICREVTVRAVARFQDPFFD